MTTSLDKITENPDRSEAILKLVWAARGEGDLTFANVAARAAQVHETLADVSQLEYDTAVQMVEKSAAEPEVPTMTRDEANTRLRELQDALFAARKRRMVAEAEQGEAREAMASAILGWSQGGESSDAIKRREIAAINADRANKTTHANERRPGKSYLDRSRFYGTGGDANDYARGRMTNGGARRGAYPSSAYGRKVAVPSGG